jgi:hypothetical protein
MAIPIITSPFPFVPSQSLRLGVVPISGLPEEYRGRGGRKGESQQRIGPPHPRR